MNKKAKKIIIGSGFFAAAVGAVTAISYKLTKSLVGAAMDREEPKIIKKGMKKMISGSGDLSDVIERMDAASERLENSGCETVEIMSDDGLKLVGHWKTPENPKRVIVAMHGWRSSWTKDFGIISEFWEKNDCAVLYAEQRAQGNSEGEHMTFGLMERYDCFAWIKWAIEKTGGNLPVYLGGLSMGATTILMTAGLDLPQNVKGIVADCGFTSPHAIWKHVTSSNLHISYNGINAMFADRLSKQKINMGTKDYSTVDALKECKVPVLFIHGTDDHFVPVEMTYKNYKACASEKRLLIVPGAEHGMSYILEQKNYEDAVLKFWKDFD